MLKRINRKMNTALLERLKISDVIAEAARQERKIEASSPSLASMKFSVTGQWYMKDVRLLLPKAGPRLLAHPWAEE